MCSSLHCIFKTVTYVTFYGLLRYCFLLCRLLLLYDSWLGHQVGAETVVLRIPSWIPFIVKSWIIFWIWCNHFHFIWILNRMFNLISLHIIKKKIQNIRYILYNSYFKDTLSKFPIYSTERNWTVLIQILCSKQTINKQIKKIPLTTKVFTTFLFLLL